MLGNRPMSEWIAQYSQSHQNSVNRFCHTIGLTYVSCSGPRVPIARLAAAQAAIMEGKAVTDKAA